MIRRLALASLAALCLVSFASIAPPAAFAQGFHAIHSPDGLDLWVVGDNGIVYRSISGGAEVFSVTVGSAPLRGVGTQGPIAILASNAGTVWRSTNSGGSWSSQTLSGSPDLYGVAFPAPSTAYVCGATGAIWKSADGGLSWNQQFTLTAATFRAIHFTGPLDGWAVGELGTVRRTSDGGESWLPVVVPTTNRLRAIDRAGDVIWIVGERGTCMHSLDGGDNWEHVNLKLDTRSDVTAVKVIDANTIWVAGGGGFVRRTDDGGATWTFLQHKLHGALTGLSVVGNNAQICSSKHRGVFHTLNGGASGDAGRSDARARRSSTSSSTPANVPAARSSRVPADEGRSTARSTNSSTNAKRRRDVAADRDFPRRNQQMQRVRGLAQGHEPLGRRGREQLLRGKIVRSTMPGRIGTRCSRSRSEFGIPLEMHPDKPDTLYFGGDTSVLYRSTDFGAKWAPLMIDSTFRSPCDIVCVPDSSNIDLRRRRDHREHEPSRAVLQVDRRRPDVRDDAQPHGHPRALRDPGHGVQPAAESAVVGTNWSAGGVQRSPDYGITWPTVNTASPAWGIDIARDDPNFIIFGVYSGSGIYMSYDGGASWSNFPWSGSARTTASSRAIAGP